jgi:hypothetical protein
MPKYSEIYSFRIFDEVKNKTKVYALDKKLVETFSVHTMELEDYATLLERAEEDKGRYLFWTTEEE